MKTETITIYHPEVGDLAYNTETTELGEVRSIRNELLMEIIWDNTDVGNYIMTRDAIWMNKRWEIYPS